MRYVEIDVAAAVRTKSQPHRDAIIRETVPIARDGRRKFDLRRVFAYIRRGAQRGKPAQDRDAFVKRVFALAGAVGRSVINPVCGCAPFIDERA